MHLGGFSSAILTLSHHLSSWLYVVSIVDTFTPHFGPTKERTVALTVMDI